MLLSARGIPGDASQEPGRWTGGQQRLLPALPLCEQVRENPISRKIWPCTSPGPLPGCLARRWHFPGGGSRPGGSAPSTQTQQLRGVGNDAGSSGCPRGLWTCRGAAQPPPGDKCHAGTRAARQSCSTTGKGEAAVKSPWRLHCGLKDGSVAAAAAKRLRQAASAPLGGHRHQMTSPPFPKWGQAGRGERALIPRSPRESARLPGEARSGRHPRLQSCRSGLGGDNAALPGSIQLLSQPRAPSLPGRQPGMGLPVGSLASGLFAGLCGSFEG